jgi:hypothetical protein
MIIGIILTVIFAVMFAVMDSIEINQGYWIKAPGHNIRAVMRGFVIGVISFAMHTEVLDIAKLWVFLCIVFWFIFDHGLNFFRGKGFFYVGKTAGLDRLFGKRIHLFRMIVLAMSYGLYMHT